MELVIVRIFNLESVESEDMEFSICILWLDADKRVVHIEEKLERSNPLGHCLSYSTDTLSQYVLEIAGSFVLLMKWNLNILKNIAFQTKIIVCLN